MAKHTLFLIHGMGVHQGPQWSANVWNKLVECSQLYPHFQNTKPLNDYAEPVAVQYDHLIHNALTRWDTQAQGFGDFAQANANALPGGDPLNWLAGIAGDEAGFLLSHVADVVIYRFFNNESGQIKANVRLKIFNEIKNRRTQDATAEFSVMAHSLGTSVAHDALAEIGTAPVIDNNINTFQSQNFKFKSIHMLANISRALQTKPGVYESVVRPGRGDDHYCKRLYSYRHELDPFTLPKPFTPVTWGNAYRGKRLSHYRGWNIHGWLHYLDNPRVHIPVLKSISKTTAITPHQEREAVNNDSYPQFGGQLQNMAQAQAKLTALRALVQQVDEDNGIKENFAVLSDMWKCIQELKDIAGDTWNQLDDLA
jgi:hypothetical protein